MVVVNFKMTLSTRLKHKQSCCVPNWSTISGVMNTYEKFSETKIPAFKSFENRYTYHKLYYNNTQRLSIIRSYLQIYWSFILMQLFEFIPGNRLLFRKKFCQSQQRDINQTYEQLSNKIMGLNKGIIYIFVVKFCLIDSNAARQH